MEKSKTVVLGVCGGIAVYKAVDVASRLRKLGIEVNVIMTENAVQFVSPLTFQSISHNPVITDMFRAPESWDIKHVSLAEKADLLIVAPATANIIGKVASGIADDMLTTTIMATTAPVLFVPAMNPNMYGNRIFQENLRRLSQMGYRFMEPGTGLMACGTSGKGRLPEPPDIVAAAVSLLSGRKKDLQGIRILITAGPTHEAIDPVRYISNHSSGKMGYSLAAAAEERGASVTLISGPVGLSKPQNVCGVDVVTAEEMHRAVLEKCADQDVLIFSAAVADYKCGSVSGEKIKKSGETLTLNLVRNPDIALETGRNKGGRVHIGFCAETSELAANAARKLEEKNFDMIVANDVTKAGAGFGVDTNIVTFFKRDGSARELPLMSKPDVAHAILDEVVKLVAG